MTLAAVPTPPRDGRRQAPGRPVAGWRAIALGLALLALAACERTPLHVQEAYVFGTRVEVTVAGRSEADARAAVGEVLREFDRLHHLLHAWQPSAITALNDALAAGTPHPVPAEVAALLTDARRIALAGDGLFDPGIGRLIALWGFHADAPPTALPDPAALAAWRARPGRIADLVIDGGTVRSTNRAVAIDLGGYAKGYALDRAAAILRGRGVANALINIGGNVLALGDKRGTPWRVGIRDPRGSGHLAALELRDGEAIGTSGDYQRFFEADGQRYAHLLDPRTAAPATGTQAVTVLMPPGPQAGTLSDALSKPIFVAGAGWRRLARQVGAAQVLRVDADGQIAVTEALAGRLDFGPRTAAVVRVP